MESIRNVGRAISAAPSRAINKLSSGNSSDAIHTDGSNESNLTDTLSGALNMLAEKPFAAFAGFAADIAGQLAVLQAGNDDEDVEEDDDDYCDDELDEDDLIPTMQGPIMVKDWEEGDYFPCHAELIREKLYIYYSDDAGDEEEEDEAESGKEKEYKAERELFESVDVRRLDEVVENNGTLTLLLSNKTVGSPDASTANDSNGRSKGGSGSVAQKRYDDQQSVERPIVCLGPRMEQWCTEIQKSMKTFGKSSIVKQGWLHKIGSGGKAGHGTGTDAAADKRRYVQISGTFLRYYKSNDILTEPQLGSVNLITSDVSAYQGKGHATVAMAIRTGDSKVNNDNGKNAVSASSIGNRQATGKVSMQGISAASAPFIRNEQAMFEVRNGHRTLLFQSKDANDMRDWVSAIHRVQAAAKQAEQEAIKAAYLEQADKRIQLYDRGDYLFYQRSLEEGDDLEDKIKSSNAQTSKSVARERGGSHIGDAMGLRQYVFNELQLLYVVQMKPDEAGYDPKQPKVHNVRVPNTIQEHLLCADAVVDFSSSNLRDDQVTCDCQPLPE